MDKYKIEHAKICVRCNEIQYEKFGGIRFQVCGKCCKELEELGKHYKEHGLYATVKEGLNEM